MSPLPSIANFTSNISTVRGIATNVLDTGMRNLGSNPSYLVIHLPMQQRTIWDIIWGCLTTLVACTWVSVHPNFPRKDSSCWRIILARLELVVWTIVAPEVIIVWAGLQWRAARLIADQYKSKSFPFSRIRICIDNQLNRISLDANARALSSNGWLCIIR